MHVERYYTYSLTYSLTYRCEAELPERLVGGVRLHRFDLKDEKLLRVPT